LDSLKRKGVSLRGFPYGNPRNLVFCNRKKFIIASPPEAGVAISKRNCFVASLLAMTRGSVIARLPFGKPWQSHKGKISFLYIARNDKKRLPRLNAKAFRLAMTKNIDCFLA